MSEKKLGTATHPRIVLLLILFLVTEIALVQTGCSRKKYRENADRDVYALLNTVNQQDPLWEMKNFSLEENPNSRYANFSNPDAQPMPEDDAVAHRLMQVVDGKKGSKKWNKNGTISSVENDRWENTIHRNDEGEFIIDQDTAFDLALMHSPNYRTAMENVYQAALSVSEERFAFDVQFYGTDSLFYNNQGGFRDDSSSTLTNQFLTGASKQFATGAEVVVGLANSLVWTFTPDEGFSPTTTLSYGFTQPFLRGAGRAIVLEDLTRCERQLLANVRQLAFYQQGFYLSVLTGSSPVAAPSGGGYPSQGVSSASLGGFYGLLANQVEINNQKANVNSLQTNLNRYEEYFIAGRLSRSQQVERVRESFLSGQSSLISSMDSYTDSVEDYLMSLGLPPDIDDVVIYSPLLEQFSLMTEPLNSLQTEVSAQISLIRGNQLGEDDMPDIKITEDCAAVIQYFKEQTQVGQENTLQDIEKMKELVPLRKEIFNRLYNRLGNQKEKINRSFYDVSTGTFDRTVERIVVDYHGGTITQENDGFYSTENIVGVKQSLESIYQLLEKTVLAYDKDTLTKMIVQTRENPEQSPFPPDVIQLVYELQLEDYLTAEKSVTQRGLSELSTVLYDGIWETWLTNCLTKLSNELMTLQLIQARARLESILLPIIDINPDVAFSVAQEHRLDWMNVRAELVDQWRNIEIVADNLRSKLDVSVNGSIANEGSNMLNFSRKNSSLTAGVEFESPLSNLAERNAYRRTLISYDQSRRSYYSYVDQVQKQIRSTVRSIELNQLDFELQRIRVESAIKNVHQCQLELEEPPESSNIGSVSDTAAENLVSALTSLLSSQNEFMRAWLQYQVRRMGLLLELGVFEIDATGRWVDPGTIDEEFLANQTEGISQTQDELSGLNNTVDASELPTVDELISAAQNEEQRQETGQTPVENRVADRPRRERI